MASGKNCIPETTAAGPGNGEIRLNLSPILETHLRVGDPSTGGTRQESLMNHWHDTMVDRPEPNGPAYVTGWTISGLAVIATIIAVWILGI
jgi:hypothetical protein